MPEPSLALMVTRSQQGWQFELVPEDLVETARDLGWELILKESELPTLVREPIDPSQSNPRRAKEDEEC